MHTTFFLLVSAQRVWDIQGGFDEIGCGDNLEKKRKRRQAVPAKTSLHAFQMSGLVWPFFDPGLRVALERRGGRGERTRE